jgi:hypothetical protein
MIVAFRTQWEQGSSKLLRVFGERAVEEGDEKVLGLTQPQNIRHHYAGASEGRGARCRE